MEFSRPRPWDPNHITDCGGMEALYPGRAAVRTGIVRRFERSVRVEHGCAGMPHHIAIAIRQNLDVVARRNQPIEETVRKARFHTHSVALGAPGPPEQPARRVDGALEWTAQEHMAREEGRLRLRLAVSSHGAIGDDASVIEYSKRGV